MYQRQPQKQTEKSKFEKVPVKSSQTTLTHSPAWTNALGSQPALTLQPKLTVNQPGDEYEQEADRVASQVMRMATPAVTQVQRCACGGITGADGECATCKANRLGVQRKSDGISNTEAPSSVHETLRSSGQPLDANTRSFMEPRFGQDFSNVRVHTDSHAAQSAADVSARAYTVGNNVVFGAGEYSSSSSEGQKLIAHELTHTIQQHNYSDSLERTTDSPKILQNSKNFLFREDGVPKQAQGFNIQVAVQTVIDYLNQPDPIAGVGNFQGAFQFLNGLAMIDLLDVLTGIDAASYFDVLITNTPSATGVNTPRLLAAMYAVEITRLSTNISRTDFVNAGANLEHLPQDQRDVVTEYIRNMTAAAGGVLIPPGRLFQNPVSGGGWNRPGNQWPGFYIGNQAHVAIAATYVAAHLGQLVFTNFIPISTILESAAQIGLIPNVGTVAAASLALKPDILNLSLHHLYEIKPSTQEALGRTEAAMYVGIFAAAGIPIILGPSVAPGVEGAIPAPAGYYLFWSTAPGVIVYRYFRGNLEPVPVKVPEKDKSKQTDDGFMEKMRDMTGLTGAALVIYLIVSEGSRIAFPPRNLAPVP